MFTFSERKKEKEKWTEYERQWNKRRKKRKKKLMQETENKEGCPICTDALPKLNSLIAYSLPLLPRATKVVLSLPFLPEISYLDSIA